jgi:hypothetical protein
MAVNITSRSEVSVAGGPTMTFPRILLWRKNHA